MKKIFLLCALAWLALPALAQTKSLLNLDKSGLAIQGYDPVAFFTEGKPVKGKPELGLRHNGALYNFATKEHRAAFKAEPAKYEPAFGFDAAAAAKDGPRWSFNWNPSFGWALATAAIAAVGVIHVAGVSEFLYWQF